MVIFPQLLSCLCLSSGKTKVYQLSGEANGVGLPSSEILSWTLHKFHQPNQGTKLFFMQGSAHLVFQGLPGCGRAVNCGVRRHIFVGEKPGKKKHLHLEEAAKKGKSGDPFYVLTLTLPPT